MIIKSTPEDCVLYAFYDLAVNPNSFDFSKFLVLAELYRKEGKFTEIHIIITPDKNGWARSDDHHDSDQQEWRLRNILMPILSLIPSIKSHTIFSSRSQATKFEQVVKKNIFPEGHSVANPKSMFEWADIALAAPRGIPSFSAAPQARKYAQRWIKERANGRKVVSLTFREMDQQPHRNNNHKAWIQFARRLDTQQYYPVVIRDTHFALNIPDQSFENINFFSEAAFNLELRIGFYEECYLNLFANNGPAELALLNTKVACLFFTTNSGVIQKEVPDYAIGYREEHPVVGPHQHTVWDRDSLEILEKEFQNMVLRLEKNKTKILSYRNQNILGHPKVDELKLCAILVRGGKFKQASILINKLEKINKFSKSQAEFYRGMASLGARMLPKAINFIQHAIDQDGTVYEYHQGMSKACLQNGEVERAIKHMRLLLKFSNHPIHANIQLAMTLNLIGELDEAEELMDNYLENNIINSSILRTLAQTAKQKGNLKKAVILELRARDL